MSKRSTHPQQGSLLLEIVLVTFLFGVLGTGLVATVISSSHLSKQGTEYVAATGYVKEGIEAVRSIRDREWSEVSNGTHGLTTASSYYAFAGSSNTLDTVYTRTITVEDVYRTGSLTGDIAPSGVLDSNTKQVTVNIVWSTLDGHIQNIDSVFYVANWSNVSWTQTTTADFTFGSQNSSSITTASNGEVQLAAHDTDWDGTEVAYTIDLAGSGDRETVYVDETNDILYTLANSSAGDDFEAYDISDVSSNTPTKLGGYDIQNATDFVVADGFAYISTTENSVEIDIVDVATMARVATIDLTGTSNANAVTITGTTLIIGRDSSGDDELWFYDVSTPSSPTLLRSTNVSTSFNDLEASTTHVFGTSSNNAQEVYAFQIFDGLQVGTLDMTGDDNAEDLHLEGNNLYVVRDDGSSYDFALVNISTPSSMSVTSSLELGETPNDIDIDPGEDFAFIATDNNSEEVIVVNLSSFTEEVSIDTTGSDNAEAVEVYGGYVYVGSTANSSDLMIVRVAVGGWDNPALIGSADKTQNHDAEAVFLSGSYAYLVTNNNNSHDDFFIYDVTTPASPTYLGSLNLATDVNDVVVSGNYAYVATSDNSAELMVIDITTKTSPTLLTSYNASGNQNALSVAISGSTLFLGRQDSSNPELYTIDVSSPSSPSVLDTTEFSDDLTALVVGGSYVYAATPYNSKELAVFDASTTSNVTEVGSYNASGSENGISIDVSGSTLVLGRASASTGELLVFDVSTPTSPSLSGTGEVDDAVNGVSLDGTQTVYLATGETDEEFMRWDISTPASPTLDASMDLNADATGVMFSGSYAYVSSEHDSQELQVIGQGTPPTNYVPEGSFTSQAYDSGSTSTTWSLLSWSESGTGDVVFRLRTASSLAGLESATWVGSDGTAATTYSTSGASITTDPGASGTQWIEWKAYLTGSGSATPVLEDVTVNYSS
jgi:hypothetical protein